MVFFKAILTLCSAALFLVTPSLGRAQEAELPIAIGDSVRVELPPMFSRTGERVEGPRVVVAAVHGAERGCLTLVAPTASDTSNFVIVLIRDGFQLNRIWPETSVISEATLAEFGIECLKVYSR